MLRKLILLPLVLVALLVVSLAGCSGNSKSDAPKVSDTPPKEGPKKMTPGGAGGKQPGPGTSSQ